MKTNVLTNEQLLNHWLEHRNLTRRVIEKFPEEELFHYTIGSMRSFADMIKELLSLAVPGLEDIVYKKGEKYNHNLPLHTKQELLKNWDDATPKIIELFHEITEEQFKENHNLFGAYDFPTINNILYFIDNEIHHRAQGYVYLRSLNIEPPFFWDRS